MKCGKCRYYYFHNSASAVAGIIETPHGILLTRRSLPPKRGYYDLPGGFVDYGESLETALSREVREELNIELHTIRYFTSFANTYRYKRVTYFTTDAFFICRISPSVSLHPNEEVSKIVILRPAKVDLDEIAFSSSRAALRQYVNFRRSSARDRSK